MSRRDGSIEPQQHDTIIKPVPLRNSINSLIDSTSRWTDMEHFVGGEYTPSGASNELWLAFYSRYRAQVVLDLSNARRRLQTSVLRVFLHSLFWESNSNLLFTNLDDLLQIAD